MTRSGDYREYLLDELRDNPDRCVGYLNAALEEGGDAFLIALKDVVDARGGVSYLSRKTDLHRVSIHKILSDKGNPSFKNLDAIIGQVGLRFVVEPQTR